ncbi:hypothetical protein [Paraburkholderia gardini]|uniref:hypothetical protein n=1 Tax=Paraburkholderia gardini TaxID=2823469 RepID=UPI001E2C27FA|nr:hypothetical protein [Paraburkholderia gardini]
MKNKLIEWAALAPNARERNALDHFITRQYDQLYRELDVRAHSNSLNSDRLLLHWILYVDHTVKSRNEVLARLGEELQKARDERKLTNWIENYLNDLGMVFKTVEF